MNTIIPKLFLSSIVLLLSTECPAVNSSTSETSNVETGIDIEENPLEAIQKVIELGQDINDMQSASENQESGLISFQELIECLPIAPPGWTAEEPQGETNSFGSYSISQVNQTYYFRHKKIKVSIFDWTLNSFLHTPFLLTTEFSQESTEGYSKGIKIGNIPGREEYTYASQQGSLNLLVDSRFLVQIDGDNIDDAELREWWQRMERQSLLKTSSK